MRGLGPYPEDMALRRAEKGSSCAGWELDEVTGAESLGFLDEMGRDKMSRVFSTGFGT